MSKAAMDNLTQSMFDVDGIRVYLHSAGNTVLMREDTRVVCALVLLDDGADENQWQLWVQAMAEKRK